jgi:hypothetical protein
VLDKIATEVRDHYIEHFRVFVTLLQDKGKRGAAEVKFSLSDDSPLFGRIHCSDYVENDDGHLTVHWLAPDEKLAFEEFTQSIGGALVEVRSMYWDDVVVSFDGIHPDYTKWFDSWFDPDDRDLDVNAEFSGKIHSLSVGERDVVVDFGTSPPQALFDLLDLIISAGSTRLALSTTR